MIDASPGWRGRFRELLDFAMPAACLGCACRLPQEKSDSLVCQACLTRLVPLPSPHCERCGMPVGTGGVVESSCLECDAWPDAVRWARSAYILQPPTDALVHGLKYGGWNRLAQVMGRRMARIGALDGCPSTTQVVPVPTTRKRERRRGYNQARLLASVLAEHRQWNLADVLQRPGKAVTQVALHPTQRRANVENAFRVQPAEDATVRGRAVVLVDDVLTTGATAGVAARALHDAGAAEVYVVTFARALPFRALDN